MRRAPGMNVRRSLQPATGIAAIGLPFNSRPDRKNSLSKKVSGANLVGKAQLPACEAGRDGDRGKTTVVTFARKNNRKGFGIRSELKLVLTWRRWLKFRLALEK
jgi:hypothetical protein